jgi:beta-glucanase (GH16 family)
MNPLPALSVILFGLVVSWIGYAQNETAKEFLAPLPAGKDWKLIWNDEFDGTTLDESKWNRLGDWKRRDGFWVQEDAHVGNEGRDGTEIHDYALLWTPEEYVFYVDAKEVWRTKAGGVSQVPQFLKLTEEIGEWGGDITKAKLPDFFEVDYVRVYEMSD